MSHSALDFTYTTYRGFVGDKTRDMYRYLDLDGVLGRVQYPQVEYRANDQRLAITIRNEHLNITLQLPFGKEARIILRNDRRRWCREIEADKELALQEMRNLMGKPRLRQLEYTPGDYSLR